MNICILDIKLIEGNRGQLDGLPANPRVIKDDKFKALVKSIKESPEFMKLREPIVYPMSNGKYIVIGGNQRVEACRSIGYKSIQCKVLPPDTKVEKLREYTIKDNNSAGENDWDLLNSDWDMSEIAEWDVDLGNWTDSVSDVQTIARRRKTIGWGKSKGTDKESRCDLEECVKMHMKGDLYFISSFKKTEEGYPLSEIKSDFSNVDLFAEKACMNLRFLIGARNKELYCTVTTPKRRHKKKNFAEAVAMRLSELSGIKFYNDAVTSIGRDRIHPKFYLNVEIKGPIVIIYDDIITTGYTIKATGSLFADKDKIFLIGINNH